MLRHEQDYAILCTTSRPGSWITTFTLDYGHQPFTWLPWHIIASMQSLGRTSNLFRSVFNCPNSDREAIIVPLERLHGFTCSSACLATLYFGVDFHPSPKTTYVIICSFDSTRSVLCRGVCVAGSPSRLVQYQDLSIIHYCSSSSSILPSACCLKYAGSSPLHALICRPLSKY